MAEEIIERTFQVTTPARLTLSNIAGSVEIHPGEDGSIIVKAEKSGSYAKQTEIEMSQAADGSVIVKTNSSNGAGKIFNWLSKPCEVDYLVHIPRNCSVDVSCVSSSALIEGLEGRFHAETVSGGVTLRQLSGQLKANSVSGRISGEELRGPIEFETVSGEVRVLNSNLASIDAKTVSGDIELQTPLGESACNFSSVSGDIRLLVPSDSRATVKLSSISGQITTNLPQTSAQRSRGWQAVEIQGGGVPIIMNSVSGDLLIASADGGAQAPVETMQAASVPPPPPPPPPPPLTRAQILERIESGEMTVEEGIQALKEAK